MDIKRTEIELLFQKELANQLHIIKIDQFDEKIAVEIETNENLEKWRNV